MNRTSPRGCIPPSSIGPRGRRHKARRRGRVAPIPSRPPGPAAVRRTPQRPRCGAVILAALWLLLLSALGAGAGWRFQAAEDETAVPHPWGPVMFPTHHRLYRDIERLAVRGTLPLEAWTLRSLPRAELAWMGKRAVAAPAAPSRLRFERTLAREMHALQIPATYAETPPLIELAAGDALLRLRPYAALTPRWSARLPGGRGQWDWSDSTRVGLRGTLYLGRRLSLSHDVFVGEVMEGRRFSDPLVDNTDILFYTERFDVNLHTGLVDLRFGRDRHRWGAGHYGTLLLDHAGQPFTFAQYELRISPWFRFRALSGFLNQSLGKYLGAHRLSWTPHPRLEISFSEGVRYQSSSPRFLYLLGFVPYTFVERIQQQDAVIDSLGRGLRNNVLWSLGWAWRASGRQLFYGEILADDIGTKDRRMPSRWGFLAGITYAPRFQGWDWTLGIEGAKVFNYVYSVYYRELCLCDWDHQEDDLGFPDGPDSERLVLRALVDMTADWGADLVLTAFRHGQGALGRPWFPERLPESEGRPSEAWKLWEPVTKGLGLRGAVRWEPRDNLASALGLRFAHGEIPAGNTIETHSSLRIELNLRVHL
ncbi:MAG: hypothetical protein GF355_10020 [Candidatus Eisenbacteria bacterium]|nr:hypothetical protein [Candidatus Eisenbacteria bacterium]